MIELFYWPTPNGHKITLFLEEAGVPYKITRINIGKGEQFAPDYLKISPNNRMPAIIDHAPADGGAPISVFESGAILLYLAEKTKRFLPADIRGRVMCTQWLFWQVGGLGPMAGQNQHFSVYASEKIPYAIDRYVRETARLYAALDRHLDGNKYICGEEYSIADMACYPWIASYGNYGQKLEDFPHLQRWLQSVRARPATARAYAQGDFRKPQAQLSNEERKILFGQGKRA